MVNMTLVRGHHAQTQRNARNFLYFTLYQYTGVDDIARFDSRRYIYDILYL
jgi:hypothetical protein